MAIPRHNVWLRQPDSGGATQVYVQGGTWENLADYAQQNSGQYYAIVITELNAEASVRQFEANAINIALSAGQSGALTSSQQTEVADQVGGLQQQVSLLKRSVASLLLQVQQQQAQQVVPSAHSPFWQIVGHTEDQIAQNAELTWHLTLLRLATWLRALILQHPINLRPAGMVLLLRPSLCRHGRLRATLHNFVSRLG